MQYKKIKPPKNKTRRWKTDSLLHRLLIQDNIFALLPSNRFGPKRMLEGLFCCILQVLTKFCNIFFRKMNPFCPISSQSPCSIFGIRTHNPTSLIAIISTGKLFEIYLSNNLP